MPKFLYNEGRVVGYSAYEIYVQQAIANGVKPEEVAAEKDWLASSIGMGASLLLKVPAESTSAPDSPHCIAYTLPVGSKLCAANTIVGSFFDGSGYANSGNWMKVVSSYGPLLPNDDNRSPSGTAASDVVTADLERDATQLNQLRSYIQIVDGVVIQPGNWSANSYANGPAKELTPNLVSNDVATVRILVARRITTAFYLLLTGFTVESVVAGISGRGEGSSAADPSGSVNEPENGDFLGPKLYPWANKIVFSVPPAYINQLLDDTYDRRLPYSASAQSVSDTAIIDMTKTDPKTYYTSNYTDSKVKIYVSKKNPNVSYSVLTVYQRNTALPPALYGTRVTAEGDTYLYPIDTIAPGTVKVYHDDIAEGYQKIKDLEDNTPNNIGVVRSDSSYEWWQQDSEGNQIPVAGVGVQSDNYTGVVGTGKNELHVLSLEDCDGTLHDVDGSDTNTENIELEHSWNDNQYSLTYTGKFSWRTLINMLTKGRKGDIRFTKPPFWYKFITDGSKNTEPVDVLELKNPSKSSNSDDLVYSGKFIWDSLITMISDGRKGEVKLVQPPFWSKYTTAGSNGDVNIKLTGTPKPDGKGGSDYSGKLTWANLVDMLKNNKSANLNFEIAAYDPNSYTEFEITELFAQSHSKPLEFKIAWHNVCEYIPLRPWNGSDSIDKYKDRVMGENASGGFYRVFLRLYNTTAGTTSKFDVYVCAYLSRDYTLSPMCRIDNALAVDSWLNKMAVSKSDGAKVNVGDIVYISKYREYNFVSRATEVTISGKGEYTYDGTTYTTLEFSKSLDSPPKSLHYDCEQTNAWRESGIVWRGEPSNKGEINAVALFESSDIGYNGQPSEASILRWGSVPDGAGSVYNDLCINAGRLLNANISGHTWRMDMDIHACTIIGDNNNQINLIDRSYSIGTSKPTQLTTYAGSTTSNRTWSKGTLVKGGYVSSHATYAYKTSGVYVLNL